MNAANLARSLRKTSALVTDIARQYSHRPDLDMSSNSADPHDALPRYMLRLFIPLWAAAGVMDWYWHKNTDIEHTAGINESLLHFCMFAEGGVPLMLGLFLEVNAAVFAAMIGGIVVHELTAFADVRYALNHREVKLGAAHAQLSRGPADRRTLGFCDRPLGSVPVIVWRRA